MWKELALWRWKKKKSENQSAAGEGKFAGEEMKSSKGTEEVELEVSR